MGRNLEFFSKSGDVEMEKARCVDMSTLPRVKEQENGNVYMWFQSEDMSHIISLGEGEIRVKTPTDRYVIPVRCYPKLSEAEVRRAIRNTIYARPR